VSSPIPWGTAESGPLAPRSYAGAVRGTEVRAPRGPCGPAVPAAAGGGGLRRRVCASYVPPVAATWAACPRGGAAQPLRGATFSLRPRPPVPPQPEWASMWMRVIQLLSLAEAPELGCLHAHELVALEDVVDDLEALLVGRVIRRPVLQVGGRELLRGSGQELVGLDRISPRPSRRGGANGRPNWPAPALERSTPSRFRRRSQRAAWTSRERHSEAEESTIPCPSRARWSLSPEGRAPEVDAAEAPGDAPAESAATTRACFVRPPDNDEVVKRAGDTSRGHPGRGVWRQPSSEAAAAAATPGTASPCWNSQARVTRVTKPSTCFCNVLCERRRVAGGWDGAAALEESSTDG
jgi:hypothetical protein